MKRVCWTCLLFFVFVSSCCSAEIRKEYDNGKLSYVLYRIIGIDQHNHYAEFVFGKRISYNGKNEPWDEYYLTIFNHLENIGEAKYMRIYPNDEVDIVFHRTSENRVSINRLKLLNQQHDIENKDVISLFEANSVAIKIFTDSDEYSIILYGKNPVFNNIYALHEFALSNEDMKKWNEVIGTIK